VEKKEMKDVVGSVNDGTKRWVIYREDENDFGWIRFTARGARFYEKQWSTRQKRFSYNVRQSEDYALMGHAEMMLMEVIDSWLKGRGYIDAKKSTRASRMPMNWATR
jgi:hypothetical protein